MAPTTKPSLWLISIILRDMAYMYVSDALLTHDMNFNPAGSQLTMHNGWFVNQAEEKVIQQMDYPMVYTNHPNKPKGMKQILTERGFFWAGLKMHCKNPNCDPDAMDCCAKQILDLQPDFKEQKSLVHKTIEAARHLCVMLPKYHCELNFIEFFWGVMKRYLWEHCDYTYAGLQKNIRCHGFRRCVDYQEVGAPHDTVDGCLPGRKRYKGGSDMSKEIWKLQTVLLPSSLRDDCSCVWLEITIYSI